ncbi:ABC transporter ATP-binding protein [Paenirhodobacter populi]|uniref:ABC transporter ATP-binding protein n=1 Tax=Paenirhodobacter populi TaxID=2306993 RepID=UPI000FE2B109|nr:ABC transporter ATP-binding protein [Sinirhodobacter populi]RWR07902.1 ABC transporter ATP-binding protein [Sinirhodobacter populi]
MGGVTPLIAAQALAVGHAGRAILSGVDFALRPAEVLCLLGPNGVGKTTLFRTLLGLIPAIAGEVRLAGRPIGALSRAEIAAHLAYVPQSLATPFPYTALDIVTMGASTALGPFARPGRAERDRAEAALDGLGIAALAQEEVTRLSGGQRQMVLIARAMAQRAVAVVMDEPTASLDFANRIRVQEAIRALAERGMGVILSTHDPDQAAETGDRALLTGRSGVIACGPVDRALTAENLSRLYEMPVRDYTLADGSKVFRRG